MRILRTFPLCAGLGSTSSGLICNSPSLPSRRHGKSPHCHLKQRHWGSVSLFKIYLLLYVWVFCPHAVPAEAREDVGTPDTGVSEGCEPPCGLSLSPPEELPSHVSIPKALTMLAPTQTPSHCLTSAPSTLASELSFQPAQKSLSCFPWASTLFLGSFHCSQEEPNITNPFPS